MLTLSMRVLVKNLKLVVIIGIQFIVSAALAEKCQDLKKELLVMQQAQNQIMNSLVNNHETFASSLEEYVHSVQEAKGQTQNKAIASDMESSARAFRARGIEGKRIAQKLHMLTGELLQKVQKCLK